MIITTAKGQGRGSTGRGAWCLEPWCFVKKKGNRADFKVKDCRSVWIKLQNRG